MRYETLLHILNQLTWIHFLSIHCISQRSSSRQYFHFFFQIDKKEKHVAPTLHVIRLIQNKSNSQKRK